MSLNAWRRLVKDRAVVIKCSVAVLLVGNSQVPFPTEMSPAAQMCKLLVTIWDTYPELLKKVVVLTVTLRPDRETELEEQLKSLNNGYYKAVHELCRYHVSGHNTGVMPVHRLFLERYKYFDFITGRMAYMIRVIKPVSLHFHNGGPRLNKVGLYHLQSYVLQELGFASGINSWDDMAMKQESVEIQQ